MKAHPDRVLQPASDRVLQHPIGGARAQRIRAEGRRPCRCGAEGVSLQVSGSLTAWVCARYPACQQENRP